MNVAIAQYVEINLFGIVLLAIMLAYTVKMKLRYADRCQRFFTWMLFGNIVTLIADTTILLLRGNTEPLAYPVDQVMCFILFLFQAVFGFLWLWFCLFRLHPDYVPSMAAKTIAALPALICAALIISNPWTHWIFTLSADCIYTRGSLTWLLSVISLSYWAAGCVVTIRELRKPRFPHGGSVYVTLLIFPIPALAGNVLQLLFYGLSIGWICSALSLLILFIDNLTEQNSRDALTGLYSRRQIDKGIAWELDHLVSDDPSLFVIIVDVDRFKNINDTYGHIVGDEALVQMAGLISSNVRAKDLVGRLGGDEFIVIGHVDDSEDVESIIRRIRRATDVFNAAKDTPYQLSFSAGFALCDGVCGGGVDNLFSRADSSMYREKEERIEGAGAWENRL